MYKLVCLDLDGTIINCQGVVLSRVKRVVNNIINKGVAVAIATGRAYFSAKDALEGINLKGPSVFQAGAFIMDMESNEVLKEEKLEKRAIEELIQFGREYFVVVELYQRDKIFIENGNQSSKFHLERVLKKKPIEQDLTKCLDKNIIKAVIAFSDTESNLIELLQERFSSFVELTVARTPIKASSGKEYCFVNITNKGARKRAFEFLLNYYGIAKEEVIAFGDSPSDIYFINSAGMGVAMSNGDPAVKEVADRVTLSCEEGGVAKVLEEVFF